MSQCYLEGNSIFTKWVEEICIDLKGLYVLQLSVQAEISAHSERKSDENESISKWAIGEV